MPRTAIKFGLFVAVCLLFTVYLAATIGNTSWQTSVFPSKDVAGYLLPIKASVRKAEKLAENDSITVTLLL